MPFHGDNAKLAALQKAVAQTGELGYNAAMLRGAQEVEKVLRGEVRRAQDAEQQPWAPLKRGEKRRGRLAKPLRNILPSGGENSPTPRLVRVLNGTLDVDIKHPAARFHQHGTRYMPARRLTPPEGQISAWWQRRILTATLWAAFRFIRRGR